MIDLLVARAALPIMDRAALLWIAAGTDYQIAVRDARSLGSWSVASAVPVIKEERRIWFHHTASEWPGRRTRKAEIEYLRLVASRAPYGLPYNFVVFPMPPNRVYYLNDVDQAWPHTYGHNGETAIAALGEYTSQQPTGSLVRQMWRLADALATMWGHYVPEGQHRDVTRTECPGNLLSPMLRR